MPTKLARAVATLTATLAVAATGAMGSAGLTAPAHAAEVLLPVPAAGAEVLTAPADGTWDVQGRGWGHGIGMSQYGANGAAASGLTYRTILAHYYPGTRLDQRTFAPIRVGLTTDSDGIVEVRATTGLTAHIGASPRTLPASVRAWRLRTTGGGCVLEQTTAGGWTRAPGVPVTAGACPVTFTATGPVPVVLPGGEVRGYTGRIGAALAGTRLTTVNTLGIEQYLRGVVPNESPAYFHLEALKAQAVAARTYAAQRMGGTGTYDICDTTACQVYKGAATYATGRATSLEPAATNTAVAETAGNVLTFTAGGQTRLATTMFSASNGGYTVAVPGYSYLKAQRDPYDAVDNPTHAWTAHLPAASLAGPFGLSRVLRVQILARDGGGIWGGRVTSVLVEGTDAAGRYKAVHTTGSGIAGAYTWPTHPDGLRGPFFRVVAEPDTGTSTTTASTGSRVLLRVGDHNRAVAAVQRRLHLSVDGWYGAHTRAAVTRFQRHHRLHVTGAVTRTTWRTLGLPDRLLR